MLSFVISIVVKLHLNLVLSGCAGLEDADEFVEATVHHVEPFAPMRLFQLCGQDGIGELLTERVDCVAKCFR